jgi:hypothetical protein
MICLGDTEIKTVGRTPTAVGSSCVHVSGHHVIGVR